MNQALKSKGKDLLSTYINHVLEGHFRFEGELSDLIRIAENLKKEFKQKIDLFKAELGEEESIDIFALLLNKYYDSVEIASLWCLQDTNPHFTLFKLKEILQADGKEKALDLYNSIKGKVDKMPVNDLRSYLQFQLSNAKGNLEEKFR